MIFFSSSGLSPTLTSASTPRSAKIAAARSLNASAINTLGMSVSFGRSAAGGLRRLCLPLLAVGPFEPGDQRRDVAALDRRAGPDPQARRGIAVGGDVEG